MTYKMKIKTIVKYSLSLFLLIVLLASCDDYQRTEVEKSFFVDHQSLTLFIDQEIHLKASPSDGTYQYKWTSEDETVATVTNDGKVKAVAEGSTNIIVSASDISLTVPITTVKRIPLEDIVLNMTSFIGTPGEEKTVMVTLVPENANDVPSYSWTSEDKSVAIVDPNGKISLISEGVTNIVFRYGETVKKIVADVAYTRPFKGPHILSAAEPYILPAANFDFGGEGYAFHDSDANNRTGNDNYRKNNGDTMSTPVEVEGDGANVGYTNPGEWLLYTVEVSDAGNYKIDAQVAVPGAGSFHIEIDEVNVTGTIEVPGTGGWGSYIWLSDPEDKLTLDLTQGKHKIKYYFEGGHNFKALRFTKK